MSEVTPGATIDKLKTLSLARAYGWVALALGSLAVARWATPELYNAVVQWISQ